MSLSRQIRSNRTRPGPGPKRAVKTFPLSVRMASGTPWRAMAASSASHTGRVVARVTTAAEITNLEWSSIPDTILASDPSAKRTPPTTSICHSSIDRDRSQRL